MTFSDAQCTPVQVEHKGELVFQLSEPKDFQLAPPVDTYSVISTSLHTTNDEGTQAHQHDSERKKQQGQ